MLWDCVTIISQAYDIVPRSKDFASVAQEREREEKERENV